MRLPASLRARRQVLAAVKAGGRRCLEAGIDLLFSPACLSCGSGLSEVHQGILLCHECRDELVQSSHSRCLRCAAEIDPTAIAGDGCRRCGKQSFHFDTVTTLGRYEGRLRQMVLATKQAKHVPLTRTLGRLLAESNRDTLRAPAPEVLVPTPMHWARRAVRGVNGPEILCHELSRRLALPQARAVRCRRNIKLQHGLGAAARRRNVRRAFAVKGGYDFHGARVLLIDDILTTGATASEVSGVLKARGAAWVGVAIVARTMIDD